MEITLNNLYKPKTVRVFSDEVVTPGFLQMVFRYLARTGASMVIEQDGVKIITSKKIRLSWGKR